MQNPSNVGGPPPYIPEEDFPSEYGSPAEPEYLTSQYQYDFVPEGESYFGQVSVRADYFTDEQYEDFSKIADAAMSHGVSGEVISSLVDSYENPLDALQQLSTISLQAARSDFQQNLQASELVHQISGEKMLNDALILQTVESAAARSRLQTANDQSSQIAEMAEIQSAIRDRLNEIDKAQLKTSIDTTKEALSHLKDAKTDTMEAKVSLNKTLSSPATWIVFPIGLLVVGIKALGLQFAKMKEKSMEATVNESKRAIVENTKAMRDSSGDNLSALYGDKWVGQLNEISPLGSTKNALRSSGQESGFKASKIVAGMTKNRFGVSFDKASVTRPIGFSSRGNSPSPRTSTSPSFSSPMLASLKNANPSLVPQRPSSPAKVDNYFLNSALNKFSDRQQGVGQNAPQNGSRNVPQGVPQNAPQVRARPSAPGYAERLLSDRSNARFSNGRGQSNQNSR